MKTYMSLVGLVLSIITLMSSCRPDPLEDEKIPIEITGTLKKGCSNTSASNNLKLHFYFKIPDSPGAPFFGIPGYEGWDKELNGVGMDTAGNFKFTESFPESYLQECEIEVKTSNGDLVFFQEGFRVEDIGVVVAYNLGILRTPPAYYDYEVRLKPNPSKTYTDQDTLFFRSSKSLNYPKDPLDTNYYYIRGPFSNNQLLWADTHQLYSYEYHTTNYYINFKLPKKNTTDSENFQIVPCQLNQFFIPLP
jgi:hypothetical protein